eukprot:gene10475-biopygen18301
MCLPRGNGRHKGGRCRRFRLVAASPPSQLPNLWPRESGAGAGGGYDVGWVGGWQDREVHHPPPRGWWGRGSCILPRRTGVPKPSQAHQARGVFGLPRLVEGGRGGAGGGGGGGVGDFGIFRCASRRANPRLAPRVCPHPPRGPGARRGADGTGGWSSFPTTVWGHSLPSWRPVGGNGGGEVVYKRKPHSGHFGREITYAFLAVSQFPLFAQAGASVPR